MEEPTKRSDMDWQKERNYPRPDYLSSSRKRLAPQLLYKGGILNAWGKKTAVALDKGFFDTLPKLRSVVQDKADIAWLVYDLKLDKSKNQYDLTKINTIYTSFGESLNRITRPQVGPPDEFIAKLQEKLDEKLENGIPPDNKTIDLFNGE